MLHHSRDASEIVNVLTSFQAADVSGSAETGTGAGSTTCVFVDFDGASSARPIVLAMAL